MERTRYEYQTLRKPSDHELNEHGKDGWLACSVDWDDGDMVWVLMARPAPAVPELALSERDRHR